eukprot:1318650-Amphidinium_carterae.1
MALLCDAGWGFPAKPPLAVLVGVLIFSVGLLGDLTVSAMKRDAGLKDVSLEQYSEHGESSKRGSH